LTRIILGLILVALASYSLTALVRFYALKKSILDIPNERSSHLIVTPRGGGLAVVATFIFSLVFMAALDIVSVNIAVALVGGGLMIAAIGWLDDRNSVSPRLRLAVHFLAAFWALYWLGGFTQMELGFTTIQLGWAGSVIAAVGIVWLINLYNFMDGIDGIAGTEAICVALGAGVLLFWGGSTGLAWVCLILAMAVGGFLVWNWPPAKIFMGDVGSGFLGFTFAVLALWSENVGAMPFIIWLLLLGVFIIDSTITLIKRISKGEKLYKAHRSHVYQLAVQAGYSHKQVTLTVLLINIILGIIAAMALYYYNHLGFIASAALIMLIITHLIMGRVLNTRISQVSSSGGKILGKSVEEAAAVIDVVDDTTE
jgi:Fuc2NAc and GlcNAc transferase